MNPCRVMLRCPHIHPTPRRWVLFLKKYHLIIVFMIRYHWYECYYCFWVGHQSLDRKYPGLIFFWQCFRRMLFGFSYERVFTLAPPLIAHADVSSGTRGLNYVLTNSLIWAVTCDFQQCGILTSVDSYEPVQPTFELRNSKWCSVSSLTIIEYSSD